MSFSLPALRRKALAALLAALTCTALPAGAQVETLRAQLDATLAGATTLRGAHVGLLVEGAESGRVLDERNADDDFQPASTLKLLIGSLALEWLGPAYAFTTTLVWGPDRLTLVGGGDPLLGASDIVDAALAADAAGVPPGLELVLDTSHDTPDERRLAGWNVDDELQYYAPVLDGLPFEGNVLHVTAHPAEAIGAPPTVTLPAPLEPVAPADPCQGGPTELAFTIRARTVAAGAPSTLDVMRGRCGDIVLVGNVPQGRTSAIDVAVDEPELLVRATLAGDLAALGIAVRSSGLASGTLADVIDVPDPEPPGENVWRHQSVPLTEMLAEMWLPSDNFIAEQLLRELDAAVNHRPGSTQGGLALERRWLQQLGIDPARTTLADGSGLSQYDRITPRALAVVLRHDWDGPSRNVVLHDLPVAGRRGDLRGLMRGTPAEGRVIAKTGSMSHVRGLAGFIKTRTHGTVIFVLSIDDWLGADADLHNLWTALCSEIAEK